ncbi:unnamed protein product [Lathyrus oleraceus]
MGSEEVRGARGRRKWKILKKSFGCFEAFTAAIGVCIVAACVCWLTVSSRRLQHSDAVWLVAACNLRCSFWLECLLQLRVWLTSPSACSCGLFWQQLSESWFSSILYLAVSIALLRVLV